MQRFIAGQFSDGPATMMDFVQGIQAAHQAEKKWAKLPVEKRQAALLSAIKSLKVIRTPVKRTVVGLVVAA